MARVSNRNPQKVSAALQGILMAVCEIWDVRGRLDHPIDYAENPEKTANPKYTEADLQAMVDSRRADAGSRNPCVRQRYSAKRRKRKRCQHFLRASVR